MEHKPRVEQFAPTKHFALGARVCYIALIISSLVDLTLRTVLLVVDAPIAPKRNLDWLSNAAIALDRIEGFLFLASLIALALWTYRAYRNLSALNVPNQELNPGCSAALIFYPVFAAVGVGEVWRASNPNTLEGNPWKENSAWFIVGWWLVFLVLMASYGVLPSLSETVQTDHNGTSILYMIRPLLQILHAVLSLILVRKVTVDQFVKASRLGILGNDGDLRKLSNG